MFDVNHLLAFAAVSLAIAVMPGPAVLYIATRSATQGRLAGLVSVLGVASGGLVHVAAAAAGLSVLLMRSATAMQYVRIAGAAYLIYMGVQKLRSAATVSTDVHVPVQRLGKIYRDGVIVNVLNPKTALFFLAFVPQFVDASRGAVGLQFLIFGCLFVTIAITSDAAYAIAASSVAAATKKFGARTQRTASISSGMVYIGLGLVALATKNHSE